MESPALLLLAPAIVLWLGAQSWRRRRLKRAARDLPTRQRRLLGPEPEFLPPEDAPASPELSGFARLHRRTARVQYGIGALACLWLLFALWLMVSAQAA